MKAELTIGCFHGLLISHPVREAARLFLHLHEPSSYPRRPYPSNQATLDWSLSLPRWSRCWHDFFIKSWHRASAERSSYRWPTATLQSEILPLPRQLPNHWCHPMKWLQYPRVCLYSLRAWYDAPSGSALFSAALSQKLRQFRYL